MSFSPPSSAADRSRHRPVMVREVLRALELRPGLVVVDGTVGAGGHASQILPVIRPGGRLIGVDRDPMMLAFASQAVSGADVSLVHSSYAELRTVLDRLGLEKVDRLLVDLGLSSDQLSDHERGFSFDADGPLDLRFDVTRGRPAGALVATAPAAELTRIFTEWGEEPAAASIAAAIVAARAGRNVAHAKTLAEIVVDTTHRHRSRGGSHPATRVFQALRIAVNEELEQLRRLLDDVLPSCLAAGGRAVIISFHSLEDRMVKDAFRRREVWRDATPKPISPTPSEIRMNPRSRTARLRAAVRL